jgi:hypothetical protein
MTRSLFPLAVTGLLLSLVIFSAIAKPGIDGSVRRSISPAKVSPILSGGANIGVLDVGINAEGYRAGIEIIHQRFRKWVPARIVVFPGSCNTLTWNNYRDARGSVVFLIDRVVSEIERAAHRFAESNFRWTLSRIYEGDRVGWRFTSSKPIDTKGTANPWSIGTDNIGVRLFGRSSQPSRLCNASLQLVSLEIQFIYCGSDALIDVVRAFSKILGGSGLRLRSRDNSCGVYLTFLKFSKSCIGDMRLPSTDATGKNAASSEYSSEKHHSFIDGKLIPFVLCIALLGFFLLTCKIIYSLGIEDRHPVFIMKYGIMLFCIVVGQVITYLILKNVAR